MKDIECDRCGEPYIRMTKSWDTHRDSAIVVGWKPFPDDEDGQHYWLCPDCQRDTYKEVSAFYDAATWMD